MDSLKYRGKEYACLEVTIEGMYNFFAESSLMDDMYANHEAGCTLDDNIVFYPEKEQLLEMDKYIQNKDIEGLKKYLRQEEIYFSIIRNDTIRSGLICE